MFLKIVGFLLGCLNVCNAFALDPSGFFSKPYILVVTHHPKAPNGLIYAPAKSNQSQSDTRSHYRWSDAASSATYRDHDLYESMGNSSFWNSGESDSHHDVQITYAYRYSLTLNGALTNYVTLKEMAHFGQSCLDRIETYYPATVRLFEAKPAYRAIIYTFRNSDPAHEFMEVSSSQSDHLDHRVGVVSLYTPECVYDPKNAKAVVKK